MRHPAKYLQVLTNASSCDRISITLSVGITAKYISFIIFIPADLTAARLIIHEYSELINASTLQVSCKFLKGITMERTLRQRIKTIKEIKNQHGISIPQIQDIVADHGGYVSSRTMYDIFAEGSEEKNFHYQSIAPIYEALIEVYGEDYTTDDMAALRQALKERNRQIDDLLIQLESKQEEFEKRLSIYEERKNAYERSISLLEKQLDQLDRLLFDRDKMLQQLLDAYLIDAKDTALNKGHQPTGTTE